MSAIRATLLHERVFQRMLFAPVNANCVRPIAVCTIRVGAIEYDLMVTVMANYCSFIHTSQNSIYGATTKLANSQASAPPKAPKQANSFTVSWW